MRNSNALAPMPVPDCPDCAQRRYRVNCADCDGYGGRWRKTASGADVWQVCSPCHDAGRIIVCVNLECPSKVWYPLHMLRIGGNA